MVNCDECGIELANTVYKRGKEILCPICALGEEEGTQSKYWETSKDPHPPGWRYPDDNASYDEEWDGNKWVKKDGNKES